MDYKGQKLCEYIYSILTILLGAIAWVVGYVKNDFYVTYLGWGVGLVLSLLLCIPDWPMFNRNPVVWLEEVGKCNKLKVKSSKKKAKKEKVEEKSS
mmetsp:Transcript_17859/g.38887  ORF Transcript_17859/g.38887 Transcript_17859/m.38887 type:complete len:96 (-) Transcript_17859:89-376(-)